MFNSKFMQILLCNTSTVRREPIGINYCWGLNTGTRVLENFGKSELANFELFKNRVHVLTLDSAAQARTRKLQKQHRRFDLSILAISKSLLHIF